MLSSVSTLFLFLCTEAISFFEQKLIISFCFFLLIGTGNLSLLNPRNVFSSIFTTRNSSCGKVMFSQACVKNSVHDRGRGVCPIACWDTPPPYPQQTSPGQTPYQADTPPDRHTPRQTHPQAATPWEDTPLGRHPSGRHPPPSKTVTAADGLHPTGMHSCDTFFISLLLCSSIILFTTLLSYTWKGFNFLLQHIQFNIHNNVDHE